MSLKATLCFEFNIVAQLTNIGTGLHMKALNMSHQILLVVQRLVANATGPELQPSRVDHGHTLFLNISTNLVLLHENWKRKVVTAAHTHLCIAVSCLCSDRLFLNWELQKEQIYGLVWIWAASMCLWMSRLSLLYFSQKQQLQYLTPASTTQQVCSSMYSATLPCSTKTESVGSRTANAYSDLYLHFGFKSLFPIFIQGIWLRHIVFAFFVNIVPLSHVVVESSYVGQWHIADGAKALPCLTVQRANMSSRILPVCESFLALNANNPRTHIF